MPLSRRKPSPFLRPWTQRPRVVLLALIGLNICAFFLQLFLDESQPGFVREYLGLSADGMRNAYAWQFFTATFLHQGPWHLIGNMLVLYLLGRDVESIIGQRHFLYLYLSGAICGGLGHLLLMPPATVLLGASGGVAAVMIAYATILPELELTSPIFLVLPIRLKAKHLAWGAVALTVVLMVVDRSGALTHSAYLGGCVAGYLYSHLLGFGRPSLVQRKLRHRRVVTERYRAMSAEQFIAEEVDPVLEKISREGMQSLTWQERRTLARAREKMLSPKNAS